MGVRKHYRKVPEQQIASYDYTDIADGTGIVIYYGYSTEDNTAITYSMTRDTPFSNNVLTRGNTATTTAVKNLDIDFDLKFNLPRNIKGKFFAQVPWMQGHETTVSAAGTSWIVIKVKKADVEIASNTSSKVLTTPSLEIHSEIALIEIDIAAVQHFKKGEILRITVEVWTDGQANGSLCGLLHDPKNRLPANGEDYDYDGGAAAITDAPESSQLKFYVPYVLDL